MSAAGGKSGRTAGAVIVALALIAVAGVVAADAVRLSAARTFGPGIGPSAFPWAIAVGLAALGLANLVVALRGRAPAGEPVEIGPALWVVGGLAGQIALLPFAGFSIATGVLFGLTARGFGRGPLWLTIPIGAVLAFALYVLFTKALALTLPAGPLEKLV
ncbi:tripartite tricarboxylate transporter TctB family protein [Methylopila henanensis]|uniref:Tripartite tricarboxylate transporter TctB family protein n=1 Tax=Methylopila henanensis TaxID=873516 RepID=A0ABW4KAD8_9HYPH